MKKIGIIGCGKIAQVRHIPEYSTNENSEIAGYFDFNQERAEKLAQEYGGRAYESVEELLAEKEIDAVSVCVANHAHAEVAIQALNAGKDVLCEKPMAVTLEECQAMVDAARNNKKQLMIGQNQRFAKAHIKAKEMIAQGEIGKPITFCTVFGHGGPEGWSVDSGKNSWFFDKSKAAMGAMADLGIHKTDLIQYLLGEKIVETTAKISTLHKRDAEGELIGVDDNAVCIYRTQSGIVGTMTASWTYYGEENNSTVVYGTEGILKIYQNPRYAIELIKKNGEKVYYDIDQIQTNENQTKSGVIDAFVEALVKNETVPVAGEDVLNAMQAVFASVKSAETGKTVQV